MPKRELAPKTQYQYSKVLAKAFGDLPPNVEVASALEWPESRLSMLRAATLDWGERNEVDVGEVLGAIPKPFVPKKQRHMPTAEDVEKYVDFLKRREVAPIYRATIRFLLAMGLRVEEFLSLDRERVQHALSGKLYVVRKGRKEETLPVSKHAQEQLLLLLSTPARVANGSTGVGHQWDSVYEIFTAGSQIVAYNLILRRVKRYARLAGVDEKLWSPHVFRHLFASRMMKEGAPLPILQRALGHASYQTTAKYMHVDTEDLAKYMK